VGDVRAMMRVKKGAVARARAWNMAERASAAGPRGVQQVQP
jgi:hypothetical protein